jgi:hypothetical protein
MGGRFAIRWLVGLVIVAALGGVAFYSYNMGVAHGVAQSVRVVEAPATPGATAVPVVIWPRPWGFGFGFFPFFPLLFILFWFFVLRGLFWGGLFWGRRGRWSRYGRRRDERTYQF